ncbi:MAG: hypothetical protein ACK5Z2_19000, partial [Bacteroidota bacterium]
AISDPVFLNNWTTTKKALFLFIAFDLPQSYVSCGLQGFVASKMSIKPQKGMFPIIRMHLMLIPISGFMNNSLLKRLSGDG